ncbi:MAG: hypothetical protein LZF60_230096 [Nitrospira sp.]|nr:MAG: hypothetical protein LZF60_230096 [Nitrospira sp.]
MLCFMVSKGMQGAPVWLKNCCTTTDKGLEVRRGQLSIRSRKTQHRRDSQPGGGGVR